MLIKIACLYSSLILKFFSFTHFSKKHCLFYFCFSKYFSKYYFIFSKPYFTNFFSQNSLTILTSIYLVSSRIKHFLSINCICPLKKISIIWKIWWKYEYNSFYILWSLNTKIAGILVLQIAILLMDYDKRKILTS